MTEQKYRDLGGGLVYDPAQEHTTRTLAEHEIDKICLYCGKVTAGPHEGERVNKEHVAHSNLYKGAPISHGGPCPDCADKQRRAYLQAKRRRDKAKGGA